MGETDNSLPLGQIGSWEQLGKGPGFGEKRLGKTSILMQTYWLHFMGWRMAKGLQMFAESQTG